MQGERASAGRRTGRIRRALVLGRIGCYLACCKCICLRRRGQTRAPERLTCKCLVVGPPAGGKTTLLDRMAIRDVAERTTRPLVLIPGPEPTRGFKQQNVAHAQFVFEMLEVGGALQQYWSKYTHDMNALLFVVGISEDDASAGTLPGFQQAGASLDAFIQEHVPSWWPVLVIVSVHGSGSRDTCAISAQGAKEALGPVAQRTQLELFVCAAAAGATCGVDGAQGIAPALEWLSARLTAEST